MNYMAFLCYPYSYDENIEVEPKIKFEQPEPFMYKKIIPIQFSVLHGWTNKDGGLYK